MLSSCVYDTALYARAVESALAQTHGSLKVVVVHDASTDGVLNRLRTRDDPPIRLYSNSRNLGHCLNSIAPGALPAVG
jgi:glycosyltransferase involved in cell wall biosynthesis